ncbi:MAG: hypothetical protein M0P91_12900 [Sulfuricurvum sp.]|jgi:hypothetical protein|uniref:hypothetical protein n=1 Tax=Sulfuricurvum sp. TaxID=2025608 RepID=UPI0025CE6A78|nr:hypothetical protein [Sulfuricurvum sp.]MCK9374083.1 hypothetical protein [Sulfuricurvum sp.]
MSTNKTVSIVFYKGPGTLAEKAIRLWTKSRYAHCEFRRSDGLYHSNDRFRFVSRAEPIRMDSEEWEECPIELPGEIIERVERRQLRKNGTRYDWRGIVFSQILPLGIHNKQRWFCSKSNADDLAYAYRLMKRSRKADFEMYVTLLSAFETIPPQNFSPERLYREVKGLSQTKG